jgi:hypothetical protein
MPVRPLYNCTVLLGGSRDNSVFVPNISATEIYVLKTIHGENETGTDPIINVKKTGKGVERSDAQERARIGVRYTAPGKAGGIAILNALYGVGNPLPLEYEIPEYTTPGDDPLPRDEESIIDLDPTGVITSVPEPKKTSKVMA